MINQPKIIQNLKMKSHSKALMLCMLSFPVYAFSQDFLGTEGEQKNKSTFLYGLGASVSTEIYKGYSTRVTPLPLIGYKGEKLTVLGPFISYKVTQYQDFTVSAKLAPRFQGYDESDSDIFIGMKERKNSLDAGFGIEYAHNDWKMAFTSMFDVLDRSNGVEVKSTLGRSYRVGPVFIEPSVSLSYVDENHVDYYYGVNESEINQDREAYRGDSALNKSLALSVATPMFFGGLTRMNIEYTWFDKNITNSPLVDSNSSVNLMLLFSKNF